MKVLTTTSSETSNVGWAWHVHHRGRIVEWCYDLMERQRNIQANKPPDEIPARLTWLTMVKGELPRDFLEAWATYRQAKAAYRQAKAAYKQALATYKQAEATYKQAYLDNLPAIDSLHRDEHPGCPWNGKTLFPEKEA